MVQKIKLFTILLLFAFLTPFIFSDSIENYKITQEVNLNEQVKIFGLFQDSNALNSNVLCSFYFLTDQNRLIDRGNDIYTDGSGYFSNSFIVTEPDFLRDNNYTARVVCDNAENTAEFQIMQKRTNEQFLSQEFDFMTNSDNTNGVLSVGFALLILIIPILIIWGLWKVFT